MLTEALAHLRGGRRREALEALLIDWRESRSPALADTIAEVGLEAERALPRLLQPKMTRKALNERWLDLATRRRAIDVPRLLQVLQHPPWTMFDARIERLNAFPDDPRIARALAAFLDELPVESSVPPRVWRLIIQIVARAKDASTRSALTKRSIPAPPGEYRSLVVSEVLQPHCLAALQEVPTGALVEVDAALLRQIKVEVERLAAGPAADERSFEVAVQAAPSESELLDAVYRESAADAPRRIYGDWSLEHGRAHGEFIAMQFQHKPTGPTQAQLKRERDFLKVHLVEVLGPLEPVVIKKTARFKRGFLSTAAVQFKTTKQLDELGAHPAWATITALVEGPSATNHVLLERGAPLEGLEQIDGLNCERAGVFANGRTLPKLRRLAFSWEAASSELMRDKLSHCPALPALEELVFTHGDRLLIDWLMKAPITKRLKRLKFSFPIDTWLKLFEAQLNLQTIDLGGQVAFSRLDGRSTLTLRARLASAAVPIALKQLKGKLSQVVFDRPDADKFISDFSGFELVSRPNAGSSSPPRR